MATSKELHFSIKTIGALQKKMVHMKNPDIVENKIRTLISGGLKRLQIVSDFDKTLTKQFCSDGRKPLSSFGMVHEGPTTPESYKLRYQQLYKKYRPIELDQSIEKSKKDTLIQQWWKEQNELLKGFRLPPKIFDDLACDSGGSLREGALDLLEKLYVAKVPVLIFSAGLGDSILAVLKCNNALFPNIKVISNFLKYAKDNVIDGIDGELIHMANKNKQAHQVMNYYNLIPERKNVILLGDSIGDTEMADGVPKCDVLLKIAFLFEKAEESLPKFRDAFDIILVDDQTMNVPHEIFKLIHKVVPDQV